MATMVPPQIRREIGRLLDALGAAGYRVGKSVFDADCFGDWYVDLRGPRRFRLTKDRGQYMIGGPEDELRDQGLFRAFDDRDEFERSVLLWLSEKERH